MAVKIAARTRQDLEAENTELRACLEEAQQTLRAIRSGEVDALVVSSPDGERIFTLQGADRTYRALIEQMNESALDVTTDGVILFANHAFAAMVKTSLEKVVGTDMQAWITSDSRETLEALLRAGVRDKSREELTLKASDGTAVPAYLSVNPLSVDGAPITLGVVATDLTRRKRGEEALRLSEAKFRNVFENASLGKMLVGMDGKVEVNSAFLDILGYSEDELQQLTWQEITHPEDVPVTENALKGLLEGRWMAARFEKRFIHRNGSTVWTDMTMSLVKDAAGKPLYILTAIYDISARKETDAALQDLEQHLQSYIETERLQLAQDLHDVPLQELYGILYRLEELRPKIMPQNAVVVGEVISEIKATLASLRTIASGLRPPDILKSGLEPATRAYIRQFRAQNPQMRVKTHLARDGQSLPEAVRVVLYRVMQEAMANSIRHAQASEIEVNFSFGNGRACLEISDNGKGFTVPENWGGLVRDGHYGLAGMAERVGAVEGVLEVVSAPGASTTVRAVIPYSPHRRNSEPCFEDRRGGQFEAATHKQK